MRESGRRVPDSSLLEAPNRHSVGWGLPSIGKGIVLLVIVFRSEGKKHADGHIADENSDRVFCGRFIPPPVLECGLKDPKNPYVGKSKATCPTCIGEFVNGRTSGFAEMSPHGA